MINASQSLIEDFDPTEYTACALEPLLADPNDAEAIRRDQEAAYRVMADAMPQIVWTALSNGFREHFNQRWYEHSGLTPEQSEGSGWLQALHEDDRTKSREAWEQAVQGQEPYQMEYRLFCENDQTYRWHLERALPLLDPACNVVKWFGTCTDIEELKQARSRNEILIQQLWRAMTETHHRVKNNLQIITTMVEMQLSEGKETISREDLHRLNANIRSIAAIHDVLTQNTKENVATEAIPLKEVIEKLLPIYRQTTPSHQFRATIDETQLPSKQGTALTLAINELVSNAIKHGHSVVEITISLRDSHIEVRVSDDGPGFPEDFDPQKAANTGLELIVTLVRWDLAGEVTFGNRPQGGAQVVLILPLTK
jgi:PAS domain S-box-containing protein